MPRMSAEQRNKLNAQLLESDDEDDDILKPSLLHPSNRSAAQVSPQTNKEYIEQKAEAAEKTFTEKQIVEQARKSAQEAIERVLSIKCFPKISKATDLKWFRAGQKLWPAFVNNDPSNAQIVNVKQANKQIIEFIGNRMQDKSMIQAALPRSLSDYHNDKDETSWNPDSMAIYIKQLKRYKPFADKKGQEQQRMLLEEQFFLELLLKKQLEKDETPVDEMDVNKDDDDDDESEEMYNYTTTEETITVTPSSPASSPGSHHRVITNAERGAQCRKLRAGDVIEYIHPVLFDKRTAMILDIAQLSAAQKEANATALSMSDGMALPMETEVRLLKRYLRGTLVDNPGALMMFLCDFKLDSSLNDTFKESDFENMSGEKSMADKIRDAFDEANSQVEQEIMKLANRETDETDAPQQCDKKRTLSEADESPVEQETGRRTPSRPRLH